ncbi:hypothetical protein B0T09DRAFT_349228 [Sordaria sp. MPI-SDFR-AT-0083]|nr:hypothetical protein B0T09DRAFT_349228 [Sordaria sp. MPI-SDFR-AT-0083]
MNPNHRPGDDPSTEKQKGRVARSRYPPLCEWAMFANCPCRQPFPSSSIYIGIMHVSGRRLPDEQMFRRRDALRLRRCAVPTYPTLRHLS